MDCWEDLDAGSEGFVLLMVSVEFFRFNVATLEVDAELLVFLCSWLTMAEFASGRSLGRMVITLDVFETGGSATGAEIGTVGVSTGTGGGGAGIWFSFSDSFSIGLTFKAGRG
jgi:hypothetical protein